MESPPVLVDSEDFPTATNTTNQSIEDLADAVVVTTLAAEKLLLATLNEMGQLQTTGKGGGWVCMLSAAVMVSNEYHNASLNNRLHLDEKRK